MIRKLLPVTYIAMIGVGITGFIYSSNKKEDTTSVVPVIEKKVALVPRSINPLNHKKILTKEDYVYTEVEYSGDSKPDTVYENIDGWGIRNNIAKNSLIMKSDLIDPTSDEYISLILKDGYVFKSMYIKDESYTATVVKPGDYIDIYLAYSRKHSGGSKYEIVSPPETLKDSALAKIIAKARVMSVKRSVIESKSEVKIVVEMTPEEEKKIIHLENANAKTVVYLSSTEKQKDWPLSKNNILNDTISVKEHRGGR